MRLGIPSKRNRKKDRARNRVYDTGRSPAGLDGLGKGTGGLGQAEELNRKKKTKTMRNTAKLKPLFSYK